MIGTERKKTVDNWDDHLRDFLIAFPTKLSEFIEFNEFKSVEPSKSERRWPLDVVTTYFAPDKPNPPEGTTVCGGKLFIRSIS